MTTRPQVAIIGTGLIGASIGLGLTAREGRNFDVIGADRDRHNVRTAKKMGAIDREVGSIEEAVEKAGLVILAVPVMAARHLLRDMAQYLQKGAILTDTCSTKSDIMRWAQEFLPEGVHFVGGHPMAGSEQSGPEAARSDLFKEATWAITPSPRADEDAVRVILGLIESLGATPLYIDPGEHDQYAAAISHLPMLMSIALFRMVRDSAAWEDMALLSGPAFRDVTRLASGDAVMSRDILLTNRDAVLHWLGRLQGQLESVRGMVEAGGDEMLKLVASTQLDRDAFLINPPIRRVPEGVALPSSQDAIGHMFLGRLYDKIKEGPSLPERDDDKELRRKLRLPEDDDGAPR